MGRETAFVRAHLIRPAFVPTALHEKECRPAIAELGLAGELGFEPRQTESESVVLPLHHSPKIVVKSVCYMCYLPDALKGSRSRPNVSPSTVQSRPWQAGDDAALLTGRGDHRDNSGVAVGALAHYRRRNRTGAAWLGLATLQRSCCRGTEGNDRHKAFVRLKSCLRTRAHPANLPLPTGHAMLK